ncbi:MAG: hypothetical protein ACOH1E_04470 [Brevundimonas sp.]
MTYPANPDKPYGDRLETANADLAHEPFIPVYARRGKARGGQGKVQTWMILAPVAVLVLGGIGTMLVMGGAEEVPTPLAEPALTAPVLSSAPTEAALAPLSPESTPAPVMAAPVATAPTPTRRVAPAPARREAAVRAPAPTARVAAPTPTPTPVAPTGPQPYAPAPAGPSTGTLNTVPAAPAPAAPPPTIIIAEPVG